MPEAGGLTKEGAVEGRTDDWGEVVTRQLYRKVRLDHLLSKEMSKKMDLLFNYECSLKEQNTSGGDALWGNTRSHPEHDG